MIAQINVSKSGTRNRFTRAVQGGLKVTVPRSPWTSK